MFPQDIGKGGVAGRQKFDGFDYGEHVVKADLVRREWKRPSMEPAMSTSEERVISIKARSVFLVRLTCSLLHGQEIQWWKERNRHHKGPLVPGIDQ